MQIAENIYGYLPDELTDIILALGGAKYRAGQLFSGLHAGKSIDNINIDGALRESISAKYCTIPVKNVLMRRSKDGTEKFLLKLSDGNLIECVLMRKRYGNTLCISTQVGCRMQCSFCASGKDGLIRNLTAGELAAQVLHINSSMDAEQPSTNLNADVKQPGLNLNNTAAAESLSFIDKTDDILLNNQTSNIQDTAISGKSGKENAKHKSKIAEPLKDLSSVRAIRNIVLMGSGEPLDNYENVLKFLRIISHKSGINISPRNISLSTCGVVPGIMRLADEGMPVTLSFSMHSAFEDRRQKIMPISKAYPLAQVIGALKYYFKKTGRRVIIEYSMIGGVNHSDEDALQLKKMLAGLTCHINLIKLSPVTGSDFVPCTHAQEQQFLAKLQSLGLSATIRSQMGVDIEGACGQLRNKFVGQKDTKK